MKRLIALSSVCVSALFLPSVSALFLLSVTTLFAQNASQPSNGIPIVTSLPATCTPNVPAAVVFLSATGATGTLNYCSSPNTWTAVGAASINIATSCLISGGPITGAGTLSAVLTLDSQTGAGAFAIPNGDCGKAIYRNNAAAVSDTIAQAGSGGNFAAGWFAWYTCIGAGGCTITPATSTINGAASLVMPSGTAILLESNGTNYSAFGDTRTLPSIASTSVVLKGNGSGGAVAATAGTDFAAANASTTVNSQTCTLGSTCTIPGTLSAGTLASIPATCSTGSIYQATDQPITTQLYVCTSTNTWTRAGYTQGTTAGKPATCSVGQVYFATDATAGQNWYFCTATNTWTQQLNSGGGGTPGGSSGQFQWNSSGSFAGANVSQAGDGSDNASKGLTLAAPSTPTFNASGTTTCDWSQSNVCQVTFTGTSSTTTLAFSNPHGSGFYVLWTIPAVSMAASPYTFPAAVKNGAQPDPSQNTYQLFWFDGSANYYGQFAQVPNSAWHGLSMPAAAFTNTPACGAGINGYVSIISDSTTVTLGATITGSGSNSVIGYCNGSNWIVVSAQGVQPVTVGGTGLGSTTAYAPIVGGTTSTGALQSAVAGTSGQVFVSQGAATKPTYIDYPQPFQVVPANCNNATAGAGMSLPTSAAPTAFCRTGSNVQAGYLQYAASVQSAQFQLELPSDWDSAANPYIRVNYTQNAATASQVIAFSVAVGCSSTTDDPSFQTAQTFTTTTTGGTANTPYTQTLQLNGTSMTSCAAGNLMNFKIASTGSQTAIANLQMVTVTVPRLLVVQAQ